MRKYQISVLIILLLISSVCFAYDFAGGTGEPDDPYQIETAEQLLQISSDPNLLDKCFILKNNIDLDPNVTGIPPFTQAPIAPDINDNKSGYQGNPFTGVFDGNDHTIAFLVIDTNGISNDYLGLFGQLGNGSNVKNLITTYFDITGGNYSHDLGGLCGYNDFGTIKNCCANSIITGGDNSRDLGGLCGGYNNGTITGCFTTAYITGKNCLGGLVSLNEGTISNCYSSGSINGFYCLGGLASANSGFVFDCSTNVAVVGRNSSSDFGGLVGENVGTISNCYAEGSVNLGYNAEACGGLVGYNFKGTINNCYAKALVNGEGESLWLGGLIGYSDDLGIIINCYSTGFVNGGDGSEYLGGLCGENYESSILNNCYFLDTAGPDNGFGTPLTDTQMKQQSSFVSWDFVNETDNGTEDIWTIKEGIKYPEHVWPLVQFYGWDGVDFADYSFFSNHWLMTDCNDFNDCNSTDLDFSASVDANDLDIFTNYWLFAK